MRAFDRRAPVPRWSPAARAPRHSARRGRGRGHRRAQRRPRAAPERGAPPARVVSRTPVSRRGPARPRCPGHRVRSARDGAPPRTPGGVIAVQPADRPGRGPMLNVRTVEPTCLVPMAKRGSGVHVRRRVCSAARRGFALLPASTRQPLSLFPSQFALYELCALKAATSTSVAATRVTPESFFHRPAAAPGRRGGWLGPVSSQSEPHASSSEQVPYVNESDSSLWASSGLEAQRSRSTSRCARSQSK